MGFAGGENLIPIPAIKISREKPRQRQGQNNPTLSGARIGFKLEAAIVSTPYKNQGAEFERQITDDKNDVGTPGVYTVNNSRVKNSKHHYRKEWPSALDVQVQRLNPFVIEAQIYERRVKIKSAQTLRRHTVNGREYGQSWTLEENNVADLVAKAWQNKIIQTQAIQQYIETKFGQNVSISMLDNVIQKMKITHEYLLTQEPPYLSDAEYRVLLQHEKGKKK